MSNETSTIADVGISTAAGITYGAGAYLLSDKLTKQTQRSMNCKQVRLDNEIESLDNTIKYHQFILGENNCKAESVFFDVNKLKKELLSGLDRKSDSKMINEICHGRLNPDVLSPDKKAKLLEWKEKKELGNEIKNCIKTVNKATARMKEVQKLSELNLQKLNKLKVRNTKVGIITGICTLAATMLGLSSVRGRAES